MIGISRLLAIGEPAVICAALCLVVRYSMAAGQGERFEPPVGPASQAAEMMEAALEEFESTDGPVDSLISAVKESLDILPEQSPVAEQLIAVVQEQEAGGEIKDLISTVKSVCTMLTFGPRKESDLPKGFPTYTPVGVVEVKEYPAHRKAVANRFWTLFRHIQSNGIAMTAPVEMEYGQNQSGKMSQQSMAFLYGNPEIGEAGQSGDVLVANVEPLTVVAIGVRGGRSQASVAEAHRFLVKWLEAQPEYEASGSPRVMGYNSPMVRLGDRFFEVQIPIHKLDSRSPQ